MEYDSNIQTMHYISRSKLRGGLNSKRAIRMAELAWSRGYRIKECRWSEDKKYLLKKSNEDIEAVAYNGFCFLFNRTDLKCITVYKLPKDFGKKKTKYYKCKNRCTYENLALKGAYYEYI